MEVIKKEYEEKMSRRKKDDKANDKSKDDAKDLELKDKAAGAEQKEAEKEHDKVGQTNTAAPTLLAFPNPSMCPEVPDTDLEEIKAAADKSGTVAATGENVPRIYALHRCVSASPCLNARHASFLPKGACRESCHARSFPPVW